MRLAALTLPLTLLIALAACGSPGATAPSPVVGTWVVDAGKMVEEVSALGMAAGSPPTSEENRKAREGVDVTMVVSADGTWKTTGTMMGATIDDAGTYTLVGEVLTLTFTRDQGQDTQEGRTLVATYLDDVIRVKPDASMPVTLRMTRK